MAKGATGAVQATASATGNLGGVLVALSPAQTSNLYDGRGDRISATSAAGATTLGYDQAGRLTTFVKAGVTTTYSYDGTGLRASKRTGGATESFTWDPATSNLLVDGSTDYVYGLGGLPLEQLSPSGALYYYQDQLGTTRALATASGSVTATFTYDALGNLTGQTPVINPPANPFGFAGQYTDSESGLIYLRARYYDPATGQFLTRDPASAQSGSFYGYAGNDPVNAIDPMGLGPCFLFLPHHASGGCWGGDPGSDLKLAGVVIAAAVIAVAFATGVGEAALPLIDIALPAFDIGGLSVGASIEVTAGQALGALSAVNILTHVAQTFNACVLGSGSCGREAAALGVAVLVAVTSRGLENADLSTASSAADVAGSIFDLANSFLGDASGEGHTAASNFLAGAQGPAANASRPLPRGGSACVP